MAVCRRPRLVIATCMVVTFTFSLGLIGVKVINDPDRIWVSGATVIRNSLLGVVDELL